MRICAATTEPKRGKKAMSRQPSATARPDSATSRRLARNPSTSAPAGIWNSAALTLDAAMAMPMSLGCQCWLPFRKTDR